MDRVDPEKISQPLEPQLVDPVAEDKAESRSDDFIRESLLETSTESPSFVTTWCETQRNFVAELGCEASMWRHASGVEVMIVHTSDTHRYFGVAFKTIPTSNQGEPHIAEHLVFRGSEKYPSQEPFSAYLKSSLYTDSNAYTGHDSTLYYHSSPDEGDFVNQIHLIMNGVFSPLLREDSFREEAWRLDINKDGTPYLNGIVLNEMKGAASDPAQVHEAVINSELLKDTPFVFNAGGTAENIPNLTLDGLRAWFRNNYTTERCRIFIYGAGESKDYLEIISSHLPQLVSQEAQFISENLSQAISENFGSPREFHRIKRVTQFYPGGETEDASRDSLVTVNWRIKPIDTEPMRELATQMLFNLILCGTDNSPLRAALMESALGEDVFGGDISFDTPFPIFTIGLSGAAAHRAEEIEALIESTVEKIVSGGLPEDEIERAFASIKYQERASLASTSLGSDLGESALLAMVRGGDPFKTLTVLSRVESLYEYWKLNKSFFIEILKESLLDNKNRLTLTLRPNRGLVNVAEESERELALKIHSQSESNFNHLTLDNPGERDTLRDQAAIPRLRISEIILPQSKLIDTHKEDNLVVHEAQTHGIGYVDIGFSLRGLELAELGDAAVLSELFTNLDTKRMRWQDAIDKYGHQSSVDCSIDVFQNHRTGGIDARIIVALTADAEILPEIIERLFLLPSELNLDNRKRVISLLKQSQADYEADIYSDGMLYALCRSQAHQDLSSYLKDITGGVEYIQILRRTVKESRHKWNPVVERLQGVLSKLCQTADICAQITGDKDTLSKALPTLSDLCRASRVEAKIDKPVWRVPLLPPNEGFIIPATVSCVGQSFDVYDHKSPRTVEVVANHLRNAFLWDNVRRSGGAYSTDLSWDVDARVISFGSGRDPAPLKSIDVFQQIPQWLRSRYFGAEELRRSIINPLGQILAPKGIAELGSSALIDFIRERPKSYREDLFERIKNTSAEDVESFADSLDRARERRAPVVVIGSKKAMGQFKNHYGETLVSVELLE